MRTLFPSFALAVVTVVSVVTATAFADTTPWGDPVYPLLKMPAPASFSERCSGKGVIFCDPMEDLPVLIEGKPLSEDVPCRTLTEAIAKDCKYRSWRWVRNNTGSPIVDTTVRADGEASLRLTIRSQSGAGGGGYYNSNFSPDLSATFSEGEGFFVQYRVRFSCERIWIDCEPTSPNYKKVRRRFMNRTSKKFTKFKISIIEVGDVIGAEYPSNHCEHTQIVVNHGKDHIWHAFHSCGWYAGFYKSLGYKPRGSRQIDSQPVNSNYQYWPVKTLGDADRSRQCLRLIPDPWRKATWHDTDPNCHRITSDVWYTVTQQVIAIWQPKKNGPRNSLYRLWIQSGDEGPVLVIEHTFYNRGPKDPVKRYGKIILLPHSTKKDATEEHPTGYVWYDSVIVSRDMIPPAR